MALLSPVSARKSMEIAKLTNLPSTVDIDVEIIGGQNFVHSHVNIWSNPSYFVGVQLGGVEERTAVSRKGEKHPMWNEIFVFAADLSTRLIIKVYCKHNHFVDNHVIGEATLDLLETPRNEEHKVDVYDPTKRTAAKILRGQLTIYLKVSWPTAFSLSDEMLSVLHLQWTSQDAIKSLLLDPKLSPAWMQFLSVFYKVVSQTVKFLDFSQPSQVAIAAVAFAAKVVIDQAIRDESIEKLVGIMGDLYMYFLDAVSIPNIFTYEKTLQRLLGQTYECAYFIRDYRTIKTFAQRAVVHMATNADDIITRFKIAFGELKIDLVLGSSLQTAVVSFRILQTVENIENLIYINYLSCSKSASWDSGRACLHGTHQDVVSDIISWTTDMTETRQSRLYLLRGPAGCGKSSIAHSIAHIFDQQKRLGAAVFPDVCIDQKTMNSQTVGSTIAYQLAGYNAKIRQRMAEIIKANPSLASANIERQLPQLIVPATEGLTIIGPIVVVVDGLTDPKEQGRLLRAINQFSASLPTNFRLLLTSRPGNKLADTLKSGEIWSVRDIHFDDMGDGALDIDKYMHQSLSQLFSIKSNLFERYPLEDLNKLLIPMAFGMHYWVTTLYRLLRSSSDENASLILAEILSNPGWLPASPEEAMDHIYLAVLYVLHKISLPVPAKDICHVLIHSLPTFSLSSTPNPRFRPVLPKSSRTPLKILEELDGIIEIGHDSQGLPLLRLQPSFESFITNPQRSGLAGFHVNLQHPVAHSLAELCLDEMNYMLTHNLCQLDDLMVLDVEILDKKDRIRQFIPATLQYACCQWISYLDLLARDIDKGNPVIQKIQEFLFTHLLHWFEVMGMLGHVKVILPCLERLAAWFKKHYHIVDPKCHIMTMDGIRFIRAFFPIISEAAMQTYISALPLMSSDTLLFKTYHKETTACRSDLQSYSPSGWVPLKAPEKWDTNRHPKAIVSSFAISGYLIAEAESYPTTTVRFYDSRTGNKAENSLTLPLAAKSIYFSPDNQHILTVDDRGTISTWNIKKGLFVHHIESEFNYPLIHLSANGNKIFVGGPKSTGFSDRFSLWNTATAECIQTFVFNISYWHNIALSPDGMTLAVQEGNKAGIQFFDVKLGKVGDQPFVIEGRMAQDSLSFKNIIWSSDGNFLATVSIQDNIYLWDIDKGTYMPLDLEDWDGSLSPDLSFSPDNSCIAAWYSYSKSHSAHSYARIWDTQTREIIWSETLGPTKDYSMSFLSDSQEILFFELHHPPIRIVRLPTYMSDPLRIHEWTSDYYIQYSHLTSSANVDFSSKVDGVGWITNTAGDRLMWVPYPDFELFSKDRIESDGQQAKFSQRKTLEVKKPRTNTVVLRFKIDFEVEANVIMHGVDFERFR